jgi:predicted nicotinamide N-methyase
MPTPSPANLRAFIRRHTTLRPVADAPGIRLHVADDVMETLRLTGIELGDPDPPLPFWAFAWAGGLAVVRHLLEHPADVAGRDVVDIASGSGLCAIVAARLGAASVTAIDVDPFAEAAIAVNARANDVRIATLRADVLDTSPPRCDVILAGDVCYEETMTARMVAWLREAAGQRTRVLLGDPGRTYLPDDLERVGTYRVRTSRELENADVKDVRVFTIPTLPAFA